MTGTFMAILDVFIVLVAAPAIQRGLHASNAQVQFILAGYQLTYAAALITAGRLGDLYGRRRLFTAGMSLFTLASLACGAAPIAAVLIGSRLVQGLGAALMYPQVFALIGVLVPEERRPRAFGVLGAVIGLSTIVGQVLGGVLIQADLFGSSWRPVFWVNVPVGMIAVVLAVRVVPESKASQAGSLDFAGAAVLTVALFLLIVPLVEGRETGWPMWTWAALAASGVAFAAFMAVEARVEARGRTPLIAPALLAERSFAVGVSLVLVLYAALNSFFLILSLTLQDGLGLSALSAGLVYAPQAATFFAVSLLAGRWAPRYGRRVLEIGGVLTALGFLATAVLARTGGSDLSPVAIIPSLMLQGVGQGLLLTPLLNTILSRIHADAVGAASGILSTAQQVGGALGVAMIGGVFFGVLGTAGRGPGAYAHALSSAVLVNVILAGATAALIFALPASRAASTTEPSRP